MEDISLYLRFGIALVTGILIGLQREFAADQTSEKEIAAGVRTFALMALIGAASALCSDILKSPLPFAVAVLCVGIFFAVNYFIEASVEHGKIGLTTRVAAVLTVCIGALAGWNYLPLSVALGVVTTVLLSVKIELHSFIRHLTRDDIYATLKFAVISAIILPVLPNHSFGPPPFDMFNPFKIWLFVVLISAISFVGYIFVKVAGTEKGIGLTGLFGGLASSTAVTVSFTQRSVGNAPLARSLALATRNWSQVCGYR
jgi:uncharacterized membrane protein (DUF4010 family)